MTNLDIAQSSQRAHRNSSELGAAASKRLTAVTYNETEQSVSSKTPYPMNDQKNIIINKITCINDMHRYTI